MDVGLALIVLVSFCLVPCIHGRTCSETFNLTTIISIDASLTTSCIQCIDVNGDVIATNVMWTAHFSTIVSGTTGVTIENGVLVINDATTFLGLGIPVVLQCSGNRRQAIYQAGFFAPSVSIGNGVVTEGDATTLLQTTNNLPGTFQQQWYNPAGEEFSTFSVIRLTNIQRDQAGDYTCRLTSTQSGDVLEDSVTLTVNYVPDIASNNPASNIFFITGTITLSCIYNSVPVSTITWFHEGSPLINDIGGVIINSADGSSTLTRSQLNTNSGGTYTCVAANVVGSANASVEVIIQDPPTALAFNETAIGAVRDRQVGALIVDAFGSMVTVPVSVEAHLCPSVQWSFKGLNIAHGDDYTITNPCSVADAESPFTFMLTVNNLTNETSGSYSATFSNLAGSGILPGLYITIPVATSDPVSSLILSVADNSDAMCLVNASTVTISCETNGFPRPSVQFLKGQEVITPGQGAFQRVSQTFTDQIQLSDVIMDDAGMYRCETTSEPNDMVDMSFTFCTDPVITNFRFTPNTMVGDRLNVECKVMGIPTPVITWLKDNVMLSSGPGIDISRPSAGNMFLSRLMINNVDAGVYTCVGTNPAGTVSREISVEVNGSSVTTCSCLLSVMITVCLALML